MTSTFLKACPCCNGTAGLTDFRGCWVECLNCGMTTPTGDREKVIAIWNRRALFERSHAAEAVLDGIRSAGGM